MVCPNCDNKYCPEGKLPCPSCGWQKGTPVSPTRSDLHPQALSALHGINFLVPLAALESKPVAEPEKSPFPFDEGVIASFSHPEWKGLKVEKP